MHLTHAAVQALLATNSAGTLVTAACVSRAWAHAAEEAFR